MVHESNIDPFPKVEDANHLLLKYKQALIIIVSINKKGGIQFATKGISNEIAELAESMCHAFGQIINQMAEQHFREKQRNKIIIPTPAEADQIIQKHLFGKKLEGEGNGKKR